MDGVNRGSADALGLLQVKQTLWHLSIQLKFDQQLQTHCLQTEAKYVGTRKFFWRNNPPHMLDALPPAIKSQTFYIHPFLC